MHSESARDTWQRKLDFLQTEEARASGSARKFEIQEEIALVKAKLREFSSHINDSGSALLRIAPTRLRHGTADLVGREKELARLDAAWHDPKTRIVTIVAWGGVGKTALVVEWMERMARDDWRGAERVFNWSFYSQGTSDTTSASADQFVAKALEFFGDPKMAQSPASPSEKGERLARLVRERRTLLVLDGVEPLQYPPGSVGGKLKDPALRALLRGIVHQNPGLCIVTTRESLVDLAPFHETTATWCLAHLSEEAGGKLLFDAGVKRAGRGHIEPDDQELKDAAKAVDGHALTLQLLGRYLAKAHNGDVRRRSLVAFQKADNKVQGGHAFRMMAAYERWFAGTGEEGKQQLAVLCLLGLFDRPADRGCISALRREPAIQGLTECLIGLDEDDWNLTLSNLCECALITFDGNEAPIDCHPLVREYFGKLLRDRRTSAWQAAHGRLYEHLTESTEFWPDTLVGLQPLYQAVGHGCQAGMIKDAFRVYFSRINRNSDKNRQCHYSTNRLGAYASDLGAARCFFDREWRQITPGLTTRDLGWLLNNAGYRLRALGRLTEAQKPVKRAYAILRRTPQCEEASGAASNLSGLELALGHIDSAVTHAKEAVTHALKGRDAYERMTRPSNLAEALLQAGRVGEARAAFQEPEPISQETPESHCKFHHLRCFRYTEVSLSRVERHAWRRILNLSVNHDALQEGVKLVSQARANLAKSVVPPVRGLTNLDEPMRVLTETRLLVYSIALCGYHPDACDDHSSPLNIETFRRSVQQWFVPLFFLTRAWLRFLQRDAAAARLDLDEAWQIAERGAMRLFMADIHLYRARLFGPRQQEVEYPWESPQADLAEARRLIEKCGYHRRDGELADAEEAAKGW